MGRGWSLDNASCDASSIFAVPKNNAEKNGAIFICAPDAKAIDEASAVVMVDCSAIPKAISKSPIPEMRRGVRGSLTHALVVVSCVNLIAAIISSAVSVTHMPSMLLVE